MPLPWLLHVLIVEDEANAWAFDYACDLTDAFSHVSVEDCDMVESNEQLGCFHYRCFLCHFGSFLLWAQGWNFIYFVLPSSGTCRCTLFLSRYVAPQAVVFSWLSERKSGVVMDLGDRETHTIPCSSCGLEVFVSSPCRKLTFRSKLNETGVLAATRGTKMYNRVRTMSSFWLS